MARKIILCKRLLLKSRMKKSFTIGVFGLHRNAGVTHIVLLLAQYLGNICGKDVEVIEASGRDDLCSLVDIYKVKHSREDNKFICRQINFIVNANDKDISCIGNKKFEYSIIDLGSNYRKAMNLLMKCDLKLILYNNVPWRQDSLKNFQDLIKEIKEPCTWCLVRNLSNDYGIGMNASTIKEYSFGFEPNLFSLSRKSKKNLKKILQYLI